MFYAILRILGVPVALIGWLIYQRFVKKKKWPELKDDFSVIVFVCFVWAVFYFALLR